jgi:hypothetical protein
MANGARLTRRTKLVIRTVDNVLLNVHACNSRLQQHVLSLSGLRQLYCCTRFPYPSTCFDQLHTQPLLGFMLHAF